MRTRVVLPVILIAALLLLGTFLLAGRRASPADSVPPAASTVTAVEALSQPAAASQPLKIASLKPSSPLVQPAGDGPTTEDHDTFVNNRIAELNQLAASNDPHSLDVILSELSNRDQAIRMAAISASIDFGSRDAIPALQNALGGTDDLKEKMEIQRAIDFLQLPSVLARDSNNPDNK